MSAVLQVSMKKLIMNGRLRLTLTPLLKDIPFVGTVQARGHEPHSHPRLFLCCLARAIATTSTYIFLVCSGRNKVASAVRQCQWSECILFMHAKDSLGHG